MGDTFRKVPNIVDLRGKTRSNGSYSTTSLYNKTDVAFHHSMTNSGSSSSFANYHVGELKWPGVAYHFVILHDGTIEWNHNLNKISYGIGNHNTETVHICLVGDFRGKSEPSQMQKRSLYLLHEALTRDLPSYKRTKGHNEYSGHGYKDCPSFNYKRVINNPIAPSIKPVKFSEDFPIMKEGHRGDYVNAYQDELKKLGYDIMSDGIYGPNTKLVTKKFQRKVGITVDGIAGPQTYKEILREQEKERKSIIEKGESIHMELSDYRNDRLVQILKGLREDGILHSEEHEEDLKSGKLKKDDAIYVAFEVIDRLRDKGDEK